MKWLPIFVFLIVFAIVVPYFYAVWKKTHDDRVKEKNQNKCDKKITQRPLINSGQSHERKLFNKSTNIHELVANVDVKGVRNLIEQGVNINEKEPLEGQTPLHIVARRKWIEEGSNYKTRPPLPETNEIAKMLIDAGAELNAKDNDCITPLHWASGKSLVKVVQMLIKAGTDVNAVDKDAYTPLHQCMSGQPIKIARLLIDAGAKINARSNYDETPLKFAESNKAIYSTRNDHFNKLVEYLKSNGATL